MGGSSKKQTVGYKYYLGVHMPMCHGPIDKVTRIRVDQRTAWTGESTGGTISINEPNLFGGEEREGGIVGDIDFDFGGPDQPVNAYLQSKQSGLAVGTGLYVYKIQDQNGITLGFQYGNTPAQAVSDFYGGSSSLTATSLGNDANGNPYYSVTGLVRVSSLISIPVRVTVTQTTPAEIPAYRGVAAAVLNQVYLGTNPYAKPWEFRAQRIHTSTRGATQWYDEKAEIGDASVYVNSILQPSVIEYSVSGVDCSSGREIVINPNGTFTAPTGWDDPDVGPLPEGYSNGYFWETSAVGEDYKSSSPIEVISKYDDANPGSHLEITGKTETQWTVNVIRESDGAVVGSYFITRYLCGGTHASEDYCTIVPLPTEWPLDDPIQLSYNPSTGTYDTHPLQSDVPAEYDGGVTDISFCDSVTGDPIIISVEVTESDINPAHIVRECLTDNNWGLGYTDSDIDSVSFTSAADTLYSEEFGLSLLWSKEEKIEEFIRDVLRHIDGTLYVDPKTGKFVLKLIRDDYDAGTIPVLNESTIISISDYKKPTIGELTNYVTVQYWDRTTSEDASISIQDIALAQQQGSIVSANVPFPGVTKGSLASRLASRTLAGLSNPLVTCSIEISRTVGDLNIGDAFKLTWPKYGITDVIMRVSEIAFGELTNGRIKIKCAQDVFGLPNATFTAPTDSSFTPIKNDPLPSPYSVVQEANYWTLIQDQGEDFTIDPLDGYLLTAAVEPTADAINYRFWTDESGDYVEKEAADFCPYAILAESFPAAVDGSIQETVTISGLSTDDVADIDIGSIAQINDELLEVVSVSTTSATFGRGVVDSPIQNHDSGDIVFFWGDNFYGTSTTLYQDTDAINVKITPITPNGNLDVSLATAQPLTFDQRAYRAWPPGNVKIDSVYFPEYLEGVTDITATWAHRDRTLQTAGLNDFTETSIGPESTTTYTTSVTRTDTGASLDTSSGLTGTTDTLTTNYDGEIEFSINSVRDSLDSYYSQSHIFPVTRTEFITDEQGELLITATGEYIITES